MMRSLLFDESEPKQELLAGIDKDEGRLERGLHSFCCKEPLVDDRLPIAEKRVAEPTGPLPVFVSSKTALCRGRGDQHIAVD